MTVLLEINNLKTYFPVHGGLFRKVVNYVRAVDGVSFKLRGKETLGFVSVKAVAENPQLDVPYYI